MRIREMIPKDKMQKIIEDIIEMGVQAVTFSGDGDSFYYPHILDTVKQLSASKVKFASLTNSAKLNGELSDVFAHHASWLRIAIHGWDAESYAKYRSVSQNKFKKVVGNMERFKKFDRD